MNRRTTQIIAVLTLAALAGGAWLWRSNPSGGERLRSVETAGASANTGPARPTGLPPSAPPPPDAAVAAELVRHLSELRQRLAAIPGGAEVRPLLAAAADRLRAAPRDAAVAALLALLDGRSDVPTGLGFVVGPGGNLASAPSLRVWMLDLLGQLDPAEGGRYSAQIYGQRDSADEWALALRNDWRASAPTGQLAPLRQRALELVEEKTWAKRPSNGFLEAFDVAVATMAWEAVPRWEAMLNSAGSEDLRRAAFVALDRLTLETPADFLPALAEHPDWLETQPLVRAGLFARADLGGERERRAVETYLLRPDLSPGEAAKFFDLAPNVNATLSHTLVTGLRAPSLHDAARLDRAALDAVTAWRNRPDFARWSEPMAAAETRLRESVAAATRGGFSIR